MTVPQTGKLVVDKKKKKEKTAMSVIDKKSILSFEKDIILVVDNMMFEGSFFLITWNTRLSSHFVNHVMQN